jgi:hypothetical protein
MAGGADQDAPPAYIFSCRIQLLQRRQTKMWMYLRPSCIDRPSSEVLSAAEVEDQIHKVLDLGST